MINKIDWIVVPGGPGLSNSYLKHGLSNCVPNLKLHYYDVFGSPESSNKNPSIDDMVYQIQEAANNLGLAEYGIINHSFGSILTMRALMAEAAQESVKAVIMLNPAPFQSTRWRNVLEGISQKIPKPVLEKINGLSADEGDILFRLIYPYYIGCKNNTLPIDVRFDMKACEELENKMPAYDDRTLVETTKVPLVRVVGECDPFFDDASIMPDKTVVIPDVGHYPFFEDAENFTKAIVKANRLLF